MQKKHFILDLLAGLTVSFAAISLGAAFGAMSGRGAFAGMIGAAVIPIITSAFGGTRIQASGPTAPMTAVTALVVAYAYDNFPGDKVLAEQFITLVIFMSSFLLIVAGLLKLGRFIKLVPNVVILGFMNGIAVLIWVDQVKKLFGLGSGAPFVGSMAVNILLAFSTLVLIYLIPWTLKKINVPPRIRIYMPGMLVTIVLMTFFTVGTRVEVETVKLGSSITSISDFFALVSSYFPSSKVFTPELLKTALPYAFQLMLLAYLDSLLTALVIDKMTKEKSKQNKELVAQGLANSASAFLQGIPGAQATIRSVLLIKEGAQTRLAGILIGVFALLGIIIFKDYLVLVASAVFVGVLFKAGLDVFDKDFPEHYFKRKWRKRKKRNIQLLFIVYTTLITVLIDLNVAVISGTIFFYIGKKYFNVKDAEAELEKVSEEEAEYITG